MSTLTRLRAAQKEIAILTREFTEDGNFLYCIDSTYNERFRCSAFNYDESASDEITSAEFKINENGKLTCTKTSTFTDKQIKQMHTHIMQWIKS